MEYCKKRFDNAADEAGFVASCEASFETRLSEAVKQVCNTKGLKAVGLSGPSCSGKTTTAIKLDRDLTECGRQVHVVSIDNFFKDKTSEHKEGEKVDLDSIDALNVEDFERCVQEIFEGRTAHIPNFDFILGKRNGYTEITPTDNDIYIFEGIQAVYPEITAMLHRFSSCSIYICVEQGIDVGGTVFSPEEIRFMRRIVRDNNFRGASPEYSMFLWQSVRLNEEKSIYPYAGNCDIRIDSTMPYEINLLSQYLRPLLLSVPAESPYRATADGLCVKLTGIEPISPALIPDGSLYYEFIKRI